MAREGGFRPRPRRQSGSGSVWRSEGAPLPRTGLYIGLLQRIWPGFRVGLLAYAFGVLGYYGIGCWTGMNARYGRDLLDRSDDVWTLQHCFYAAGITFTTIGYSDELGTDDVRIYRDPANGRHHVYNSHDGLVPPPGGDAVPVERLELVVDYSFLTTLATVGIALVGMGVFIYAISAVTAFFVDGVHLELQRVEKVRRRVARMKGHVIVCGASPTGLHTVHRFHDEGTAMVVVDPDPDHVEALLARFPGVLSIRGDPTDIEVLHRAGLDRAMGIVTTMGDDRDNLVVIVTARQENPALRILSRAESRESAARLLRAGASEVVAPSFIGGMRMASEAIRPSVVRLLDGFLGHDEDHGGFRFAGLRVGPGSPLRGCSLGETRFGEATGLRVVALRLPGERAFIYNPSPEVILVEGAELGVVADDEGLERARGVLDGRTP